ncbi:MAG: sulfite exporter TauE/SafE family protein, partial [Gammaproteobacteria bacterium]
MTYLFLFACGAIAWFFSTVVAGGAATLLIPVISFLLGAQLVAPVVSLAALIANPSRMLMFRHDIDWKVLSYMI